MKEEIAKRKTAINRWIKGEHPERIAKDLGKTKQWIYKWIKRYKEDSSEGWYESRSTKPKQVVAKIMPEQEETIIRLRQELAGKKYSQIGAISIQYEFRRLGLGPPAIWTINRVLQRNDLIYKSNEKRSKSLPYPELYISCQQMDLVGPRYLKGGFRFFSLNIIDKETHYAHTHPIKDKSAESIMEGLVQFWKEFGLPDSIQMDNELAFRGSNRHPRSLGIILRFILAQHVVPIFIPNGEPWRNGIIEKFNDKFNSKFYRIQEFNDFEHLKNEAKVFDDFHNQYHRYSSQNNKTPNEMLNHCLHKCTIPCSYTLPKKIPLEEGLIIFVRFIRSDLRLSILGSVFTMKKELVYSYVVAEIIIHRHILLIKQDNIIHHIFPFDMPVDW